MAQILLAAQERWQGKMAIQLNSGMLNQLQASDAIHAGCGGTVGIACSAGHNTLNIAADGTIYPCPFLNEFPLGRVGTDSLLSVWQNSPVLRQLRSMTTDQLPKDCQRCALLPGECNGGCRAAAWLATGDFWGKDPSCCKIG